MAGLKTLDKIEFIYRLKDSYPITELCKSMDIARSTYYYHQKQTIESELSLHTGKPVKHKDGHMIDEEKLINIIKQYCIKYPYHGYRMITAYLRFRDKLIVNQKRIYRIMKRLNLLQDQITPKAENYKRSQKHELTGPNQLWEMDMTQWYLDKCGQWAYMFDIIDVFTREVVGYSIGLRCRTQEALSALKQALGNHGIKKVILRTDNGVQFRSRKFQKYLRDWPIEHERIAVNTPEQNAYIESFHGTLKREAVYPNDFSNISVCKEYINRYIKEYNNGRPHSSLSELPPAYFRERALLDLLDDVKLVA